jgi:hypothetical protein
LVLHSSIPFHVPTSKSRGSFRLDVMISPDDSAT